MKSAGPAHVCPQCKSESIERDRRTVVDRLLGPLFRRRPYRCRACGGRFLDRPVTSE
jgi:predicted Zn-ribbon and HTH transcriptional regulator